MKVKTSLILVNARCGKESSYLMSGIEGVDGKSRAKNNVGRILGLPPLGVESGMRKPGKQCRVEPLVKKPREGYAMPFGQAAHPDLVP